MTAALRAHERRRAARTDLVWAQSRIMYNVGISSFPPLVAARNALFRLAPLFLQSLTFFWLYRYTPFREPVPPAVTTPTTLASGEVGKIAGEGERL